MYTVVVLFRLIQGDQPHCLVSVGGYELNPENTPIWWEVTPITGNHTYNEWEEIVRPHVKRFAKSVGVDPATLHGGRLAYSGQIHAMMEFDFDSPEPDDDTLGPCGCTDYHMADCPTRTDGWSTFDEYDERDDRFDERH